MKQDTHVFIGMKRDSHPIKQDSKYLWDARNVRLTSRDGNTFMSITNEKSTERKVELGGEYIGHCVCGKYLVIFTKHDNIDYIKRVDLDTMKSVILYKGDLGLDTQCPIQAFCDFESELIQKVYWTDGVNRPRVLNIVKNILIGAEESDDYTEIYKEAPFDFVQDLKLNERVSVERINDSVGAFSPGVIQYAFTYYYKYGQETNIFHVTEPLYIAYKDRGGDPDKSISTSLNITVQDVELKFDYLRIYSILRTTKNSVPTVKRVIDIPLKEQTGSVITFTDNNTQGDVVDPAQLLYIGGKDIVAGCMYPKDRVMFMGDITYKRREARTIQLKDSYVKDIAKELTVTSVADDRKVSVINVEGSQDWEKGQIYPVVMDGMNFYFNQLDKNTSTFKTGETYRLGIQFQYKNGEWSEPIYIGDKEISPDVHPSFSGFYRYEGEWRRTLMMKLPAFSSDILSFRELKDKGYIKARPLIVMPEIKNRKVLAQGILCPTVFNAYERSQGSPHSKASWLLRPWLPSDDFTEANPLEGVEVEFRHKHPLLSSLHRGAEIQNMYVELGDVDSEGNWNGKGTVEDIDLSLDKVAQAIQSKDSTYNSAYYVDQSVLTFHSPDIEFDDALRTSLSEDNSLKVRIVGKIPFTSNYGEIDIETSSTYISPDARGYIHNSSSGDGSKSLISGLFYEDSMVDSNEDNTEYTKKGYPRGWMTYMWHRSGSLNNDVSRTVGTRSAVLRKKKISNIKFSDDNIWETSVKNLSTSRLYMFDSNEVSLVKIKDCFFPSDSAVWSDDSSINYYGNVNVLNTCGGEYRLVHGTTSGFILDTTSPVTVKGFVGLTDAVTFTVEFTNKGEVGLGSALTGIVTSDSVINGTNIKGWNVEASITMFILGSFNRIYFDTMTVNNGAEVPNRVSYIINHAYGTGEVRLRSGKTIRFDFNDKLTYIEKHESAEDDVVGRYVSTLRSPKDPVRIKYKSTPHIVFANLVNKKTAPISYDIADRPYLYLAEIYRENTKPYSDTPEDDLWIPAGPAVGLEGTLKRDNDGNPVKDENDEPVYELIVKWLWGDTWYQRYDCLKTYPFTNEDENQVVEIGSFMVETRVNIDGRYDRNRGQKNNLDMSPVNFNKINPVYSQLNNFFNYRQLDDDWYQVTRFPSQLMWTLAKSPASEQDQWTNLHMANSLDMDGAKGVLNALAANNENLYAFQDKAISKVLFNTRVQIPTSDGVPIEISNNERVDGCVILSSSIGCQDKFSIKETPSGIYFLDNYSSSIFRIGEHLENIGINLGTLYWSRENKSDMQWRHNPHEGGNNGIRIDYDPKYGDVYFIPGINKDGTRRDALCFSEPLNAFTSFMSYGGAVMFPYNAGFFSIAKDPEGKLVLWENFPQESHSYNNIFGVPVNYSISFISNSDPASTKIFDNIEMRADTYLNDDIIEESKGYTERRKTKSFNSSPFNFIKASNEYQDSWDTELNAFTLRKKFRQWRAMIPRNKGTRERMLNTWCNITLGYRNPGNKYTILHDLSVNYTI